MTHARLQRQLSAYLDRELGSEEADAVRVHLEQCDVCRGELKRLQRVKRLLGMLPEKPAPATLWQEMASRLDEPARPWAIVTWMQSVFRRPATAMAAAVLIVALMAVPLVRGRIDRLRAASIGVDVYVREHALQASTDPLVDRAYLGLLIGDANVALVGEPRWEEIKK